MPSSLNGTGVTFNDGSTLQSGNIPTANLGSGTANSTTFLRGDRTFAVPGAAAPVVNTFNSSGTWTKPATGTMAHIEAWGGGGGGARSNSFAGAGGGGGGAYNEITVPLSSLPSSLTVTVGAGGAAGVNAGFAPGGGNTTFGSVLTAFGGEGGGDLTGTRARGAGAGPAGRGSGTIGGFPRILLMGNSGVDATSAVGGDWHGGGGTRSGAVAGSSLYGGGGGAYTSDRRGTSLYGGNGGFGGTAGTQPGGGGGASNSPNTARSAGGAGRVIVTVF